MNESNTDYSSAIGGNGGWERVYAYFQAWTKIPWQSAIIIHAAS
jgi:hypothetical protein